MKVSNELVDEVVLLTIVLHQGLIIIEGDETVFTRQFLGHQLQLLTILEQSFSVVSEDVVRLETCHSRLELTVATLDQVLVLLHDVGLYLVQLPVINTNVTEQNLN